MKKYRYASYIFIGAAILLSDIMCAAAAYNYCNMQWGIRYEGFSAPASTVFWILIPPYAAGILICLLIAWFSYKKYHKTL